MYMALWVINMRFSIHPEVYLFVLLAFYILYVYPINNIAEQWQANTFKVWEDLCNTRSPRLGCLPWVFVESEVILSVGCQNTKKIRIDIRQYF